MQKVLVPLLVSHYGNDPYLYLMVRLKDKLDFVVLTYDQQVVEDAQNRYLNAHLLEAIDGPKTRWFQRLMRFGFFRLLVEFRRQRRWASQAKSILQHFEPAAILLPTDQDGLYYHLCKYSKVNSVIPQITMDVLDVEALIEYFRLGTDRILDAGKTKNLVEFLAKVSGRQLLPRLGSETYFPHGKDLWRTIGAFLAGVRYNVARKGGAWGNFVCVNGPHYRESFAQAGVSTEKIVVTGSPNHDRLVETFRSFSEAGAIKFKTRFNIPPHTYLVSFFLQPDSSMARTGKNYAEEVAWVVNELLNVSSDVIVMIKVHPKENAEKYAFLTNNSRVLLVDARQYPGDDFNTQMLLSSRLAVIYSSTVGYSALALEVPLLTYRFDNLPVGKHFQIIGGNRHVTRPADFAPVAKALLFDEQSRQELIGEQLRVRGNFMMLDGCCCDRIGAVISSGKLS